MRVNRLNVLGLAAALVVAGGVAVAEEKPLTERKETLESAVATPVEDLNLKKTKIPEVLIRAQANPYELAGAETCEAVAAEVREIGDQLGDDYDDLVVAAAAKEGSKGPSAGALLKAGVAQAIPFRGLLRQLSGAAEHDKAVEAAIDAGFARRGFLKGRAIEMNCPPPASPMWFSPRAEAATTTPLIDPETPTDAPLVKAEPLPVPAAPLEVPG
jgi:hypothetical protein